MPISFHSSSQAIAEPSTGASEYSSAYDACQNLIWATTCGKEFMHMCVDNNSAIKWLESPGARAFELCELNSNLRPFLTCAAAGDFLSAVIKGQEYDQNSVDFYARVLGVLCQKSSILKASRVHDLIQAGKIKISFVRSPFNLADLGTKPHNRLQLSRLCRLCNLVID